MAIRTAVGRGGNSRLTAANPTQDVRTDERNARLSVASRGHNEAVEACFIPITAAKSPP